MHRIRLREPWTAGLDADSGAIVYSRKFHKPTGVDEQSITLCVFLLPRELSESAATLEVLVNGRSLSTGGAEHDHPLRFELEGLTAFNSVELRISGLIGKTGLGGQISGATAIPPFGSFVIESVELAID